MNESTTYGNDVNTEELELINEAQGIIGGIDLDDLDLGWMQELQRNEVIDWSDEDLYAF